MLLPEGKNFRIFGFSYGLVGDLVMSLPMLTYYEKLYPGSYKIFAIERKVGYMAPFFLNHPLIDRLLVTEEWNGFGTFDKYLADTCYIKCTMDNWRHSRPDWYNYKDCIEETAYVAGVDGLLSVLSYDELYPKLEQWFDVGSDDPNFQTYSKQNGADTSIKKKTIALWPFATATGSVARSPFVQWWRELVGILKEKGYEVLQFGMPTDKFIFGANRYNHLTFFDQVRLALSCGMSIGTDSGSMWVMGAYSHPALHLMTNWMQHHTQNFDALLPVNRNGHKVFAPGGVNNICIDDVIHNIKAIMGG